MILPRRLRRIAIFVVLAAFAAWMYRGLAGDPRMSVKRLRGLTPEQVVARLGPPDYDPRALSPAWTPADEATGDPLRLTYEDRWSWQGHEYSIVFHDGHVVDVKTGTK